MYIIEIIAKLIKKSKEKKEVVDNEQDYYCEHVYLPLDSTSDYLACNKCGDVIKNNREYKKESFFKNPFSF